MEMLFLLQDGIVAQLANTLLDLMLGSGQLINQVLKEYLEPFTKWVAPAFAKTHRALSGAFVGGVHVRRSMR